MEGDSEDATTRAMIASRDARERRRIDRARAKRERLELVARLAAIDAGIEGEDDDDETISEREEIELSGADTTHDFQSVSRHSYLDVCDS